MRGAQSQEARMPRGRQTPVDAVRFRSGRSPATPLANSRQHMQTPSTPVSRNRQRWQEAATAAERRSIDTRTPQTPLGAADRGRAVEARGKPRCHGTSRVGNVKLLSLLFIKIANAVWRSTAVVAPTCPAHRSLEWRMAKTLRVSGTVISPARSRSCRSGGGNRRLRSVRVREVADGRTRPSPVN